MEKILKLGAELGAIHALTATGQLKPYINKTAAFRLYGRKNVERWIAQAQITPRKDGDHSAAWRIDRLEIAVLHATLQLNEPQHGNQRTQSRKPARPA